MDDIERLQEEFSAYPPNIIREAFDTVPKKLVGMGMTGHGNVKDGKPVPGVKISSNEQEYAVRLTAVNGGLCTWDEYTMKAAAFPQFVTDLRATLRRLTQG